MMTQVVRVIGDSKQEVLTRELISALDGYTVGEVTQAEVVVLMCPPPIPDFTPYLKLPINHIGTPCGKGKSTKDWQRR
jgi:hypothetical protein